MLTIDRILEISNEMGVTIKESTEGNHYIFNEEGEKVVFNPDILRGIEKQIISEEFQLDFSDVLESNNRDNMYKLSKDCDASYTLEPMDIDETNVMAA